MRALPSGFFSCDWGTSSFRLRAVSWPERTVLGEVCEAAGVKVIHNALPGAGAPDPKARDEAFGSYLRGRIAELAQRVNWNPDGMPVVISGMASSSIGWKELPYAGAPCSLDLFGLRVGSFELFSPAAPFRIWMISGVRTADDVLRGEETEVLGLSLLPQGAPLAEECVVVLPGTHSKHVRVTNRRIVDFRTYMSGELYDLLATHSILRQSVDLPSQVDSSGNWEGAFLEGVDRVRREGLSGSLFKVRTRQLLLGTSGDANRWFLNGLLQGAELLDLVVRYPRVPIVLAAGPRFERSYRAALQRIGGGDRLQVVPSDEMKRAIVEAHAFILEQVDVAKP